MSIRLRQAAYQLRKRYAACFRVPIAEVQEHEYPNGEIEVWHGDLPRWTTGELEPKERA